MTAAPRVLVTRPSGQCEALCRALEQAGFDARPVPVIDIVPHSDRADIRRQFDALADTDLLVFVSRNAVRHAAGDLPPVDDITASIIAVGPATASALVEAGLRCDVSPDDGFTSEALLAHPALNEVDGKRVIIVRGDGGRALLGDTLRERGADVHYVEVYRRDIPADAAGRLNNELAMGIDAMTATSVETLSNIDALTRPEHRALLIDVTVVTASERVLKKAQSLGYTRDVVLAAAPDDSALVDALLHWRDAHATDEPETASMASDKPTDHNDADTDAQDDATFDEAESGRADDTPEPGEAEHARASEEAATEAPPPSEPPPPPAPAPAPEPAAASSNGGGRGIGILAVLLALGAAGIGGLAFKTAQTASSTAETLGESVQQVEDPRIALGEVADGLRGEIESIRDDVNGTAETLRNDVDRKLRRIDLDPLNTQVDEIANEQGVLDRRISGQKRAIDTVTGRLVDMESDLASLQGVSDTVRNTWVRAEAEYFLQTANSRLQLAGDVQSALSALRAADERIGALGDPGLIPIRAQITEEILAVEAVPMPDVEGTALALLGMAERVTELPLRADEVPQRYEAAKAADSDSTGWSRAKEKVSDAFSGIVRMSPSDGSSVSVVAPEDSFFIYRNLELNLTIARLALMRQDQENYTGSLEAAHEWLDMYFDTSRPGVSNMMTRLNDIKDLEIDPDVPDISESLRMLRVLVDKSSTS